MEKQRIQFYANPELKRRIEEAAAKHNVPVAEYCLEAVEEKLAEDTMAKETDAEISPIPKKLNAEVLREIDEERKRILAERGGKPIEIDILELVRSERDDELTGLH